MINFPKKTNYQYGSLTTIEQMVKSYENQLPENKSADTARKNRENEILKATKIPNLYVEHLNLKYINHLLKDDFYQYNVMEGLHILSEELLKSKNLMETSKKVHQNIEKLTVLGAGANGNAFSASIGDKSDSFRVVIKTAIDAKNDDLMHEVFVGLAGTNKLRMQIPNFSFIYGGFKCDGPRINANSKEIKNFCTGKSNSVVTYALYENIKGQTVEKMLPQMDADTFIIIYLQVLLALNYANTKINFTHYDLHFENVIVRNPFEDQIFTIEYPTETLGNLYVYSNSIATFIDYGFSHITYKNKEYGIDIGFTGQDGSSAYPLCDAFKFLCFCMSAVNDQNVLKIGKKILKFFTNQTLDKIVTQGRPVFYYLQNNTELKSYSLEPLIKYIIDNIDVKGIISNEKNSEYKILMCENTCLTLKEVIKESTK
jgi:hypothetical protein